MKTSKCLLGLAILMTAVGCRSTNNDVSRSTTIRQTSQTAAPQEAQAASASEGRSETPPVLHGSSGDFDYTVEVIPNPHLSATSREGDNPTEVYSSNIVAVKVHPRNGATANSTKSPATPKQEDNPESATK